MRKVIITSLDGFRVTAEEENGRITGLFLENPDEESLVGKIYVGRVKHIVKNIRAAFVDIGKSVMCYYSLEEWEKYPCFGRENQPLREGDELLCQVEKDALKTKAPVVSTKLSLTGEYLVMMSGKNGIHFSSRIKSQERKQELGRLLVSSGSESPYGVIIRTNGEKAPNEVILAEKERLEGKLRQILSRWQTVKAGSLLYEPDPAFLTEIFNNRLSSLNEIITDDVSVYGVLCRKAADVHEKDPSLYLPSLRFYEDSYSLSKLYNLEAVLERASKERVWLKSGGYLIIQPTEALVSIDVNTGKYDGKKSLEETFFKTNLEAAEEIALQLKLRNLSGIIIVDFIDMKENSHKEELLEAFRKALDKDSIKTTLLGFTRLNLVELTRKKIRKPLHEIIQNCSIFYYNT